MGRQISHDSSKLPWERRLYIDKLTIKASRIFYDRYGDGNGVKWPGWDIFLDAMYRAAKYSKKDEWKDACDEIFNSLIEK